LKNKFAPIFFFFFFILTSAGNGQHWSVNSFTSLYWRWPSNLVFTGSLRAASFIHATSAGLASAGCILALLAPALACKASVGSPLLAAYGLPVSSYIYIYI